MDDVETMLRQILSKFVGQRTIGQHMELLQDLGLDGDDAAEFFDEVRSYFGTNFSGFQFAEFFPDESDALGGHIVRSLGFRSVERSLVFEHVARVVRAGQWMEP